MSNAATVVRMLNCSKNFGSYLEPLSSIVFLNFPPRLARYAYVIVKILKTCCKLNMQFNYESTYNIRNTWSINYFNEHC